MATGTVMAISAVIQAAGAVYQGVASADAKRKQAKQVALNAQHNAKVLRNKAEQEKLDRQANSEEERRQQRQRQEAIKGGVAKSGLMMEGTPTNTLLDQISVDEANNYDNDRISAMKQKNFELQAQNTLIQGSNTSKNLNASARSSLIGAGISAVGSAVGAYGSFGGSSKTPVTTGGKTFIPTPYQIGASNSKLNIKVGGY